MRSTPLVIVALLTACSPAPPPLAERRPARIYPDTLPTAASSVRRFCAPPEAPLASAASIPGGARVYPTLLTHPRALPVAMRCVVRNPDELDSLWHLGRVPSAPMVDLRGKMIVVAAAGPKGSNLPWIGIDSVSTRADTSLVWVTEGQPGRDCIGQHKERSPAAAIVIARTEHVRFVEKEPIRRDCT